MPGFPLRPGRSSFGPDPINARPVRDPRKQLDGETTGRLMFWQLGGLGVAAPLAWIDCSLAGTAVQAQAHAEAFQPRGGSAPTVGYTSVGQYTFSYSAQYPDETGTNQPLVLRGGLAVPVGLVPLHGQIQIDASARAGSILFWDLAGVHADAARFFVVLW